MPHGVLKSARLCFFPLESSDRHEPLATLGDFLGGAGVDAVHWSSLGLAYATDLEIMAYAKSNDYAVLTHDLDFGAILAATGGAKPSVIQVRSMDVSTAGIGSFVITALRQMTQELEDGALVTVDPKRTRLRVLPLKHR